MNAAETKEAVRNAFKALRKQNLIARMNFSCCSSCAGYELSEMMKKKREAGKPVDGMVYYHRQDAEAFTEPRRAYYNRKPKSRTLHLRYSCEDLEDITNEEADIDPDTWKEDDNKMVAVGKTVVAALKAEGLEPVWDENPDVTIQVNFEV